MHRIVRKHPCGHRDDAWRAVERVAHVQANGLTVRQRFCVGPLGRIGIEALPISLELEAISYEAGEGCVLRPENRRIQQAIGRVDLEIVPHVEDVGDDGHLHVACADAHVDIAEGHRMGRSDSCVSQRQHDDRGHQNGLQRLLTAAPAPM